MAKADVDLVQEGSSVPQAQIPKIDPLRAPGTSEVQRILDRVGIRLYQVVSGCMVKSAKPVTWSVYVVRGKLTWLGSVQAASEADALRKAADKFSIRKSEAWRLTVQRE